MPYLNIKIAAQPSDETSRRVATLLTELTSRILGKKAEVTAVSVEFVEPKRWFIGTVPLDHRQVASYYLDIKITEGTNTKNEKAEYVQEVFAGMEGIIGEVAPASYILLLELPADAWGYQGRTQEFRYIKGKGL